MSTPAVPQHCPLPRELDDLELLVGGAFAPTSAFNEPGSPVTLTLPAGVAEQAEAAGAVELVDPEGLPLARVQLPSGAVEPLTHAQFGPFRSHYLTPAQAQEQHAGRTFVPVTDALTSAQLEALAPAGPLALLALVGAGTPALSPVALLRASLAAAQHLPDAVVVAVPLAAHGDAETDHALGLRVVANYAGANPVLALPSDATDDGDLSAYPADIAEIVDFDRPAPDRQGLVLFFTGLSGSGKSTLARALMDRLLEHGERTVTTLDGDVVRRHLSAGLTFSKEDRETNIRRIGWVAAEISRHGGVAVCSPIAPFDETRQQVRAMVEEAGGAFFLVHVATPLEECERRDRKGLYAKARRGEIPEFTGISSPYEEPEDADVRVDTTGRTIEDALDDVLVALREEGYLDLTGEEPTTAPFDPAPVVEERARASVVEAPAPDRLRVLFVCTANICRSPYMELVARHHAGDHDGVEFASAGTHGFRAREMDPVMAATLGAHGITADGFASRPLTGAMVEQADLVLTAEAAHRTFILDDHPGAFRKVFTLGQFAEAVQLAPDGLTGRDLLKAIGERRGSADPELDVPDPYGRGAQAAEAAAQLLTDRLRAVLTALLG
ncbi:adenylyl-sulfate kinase [Nocardioides sp. MAHUQ-72]|uniref:adenylyl-sulfate kinase n=1 Tax=unclassified Nocardioides TaxID=2615069 RepID=UPI0036215A6B